jgi:hypothetical protein
MQIKYGVSWVVSNRIVSVSYRIISYRGAVLQVQAFKCLCKIAKNKSMNQAVWGHGDAQSQFKAASRLLAAMNKLHCRSRRCGR